MSDFFSKIDNQIKQQINAKSSNELKMEKNEKFSFETINRLLPTLEEYVEKLKERNIKVSCSCNERAISIQLVYRNSGYNSFVLVTNRETGRLEFRNFFTGDDNQKHESTDGSSYDENTWKDDIFKEHLEKLIQEFVTYAPRYGGF